MYVLCMCLYNNNNIFSLIKHLTNALRCTFTCYAIETILTTNRTDSLQYNGANSSLQSISAQWGSNSVPLTLYPRCVYVYMYMCACVYMFVYKYVTCIKSSVRT